MSSAEYETQRLDLVARVTREAEKHGWTRAEIARRSGVSSGTFYDWMEGKYKGRVDNVNARIAQWLDQIEEVEKLAASVPQTPGFIDLGFSRSVIATLSVAQIMPALVMITAAAGCGKTTAARHYAESRANVHLVTMDPQCRGSHNMLARIADKLAAPANNSRTIVRAIGERIRRQGSGTLLIIDEAQTLSDDAIDQLRHFVDEYQAGVALMGNNETYKRFAGWDNTGKYGQLRRRVFKRIQRDRPASDDIAAYLDAWAITDPHQREFLTGVGMKPGALGQIEMTIKLARMTAEGAGRGGTITLSDLRAAWANRDVEAA